MQTGEILPTTQPRIVVAHASIAFSHSDVLVAPGKSVTIQATFTLPKISAAEASLYPFYSGWVVLTGKSKSGPQISETLRR